MISSALILGVLLLDQIVKIYVKTHFYLGESVEVTSWFNIRFVENNGIAFGVEIFSNKIFLTILRILAVIGLGFYLRNLIKKNEKMGYVLCVAAIIAGAFGNIIDCVFYGYCFEGSLHQVAQFAPGEGYAPLFYGRVVDMLHFPLFSYTLPEWVPFVGGNSGTFFSPVFNIADSAITVSVVVVLIWYRNYILKEEQVSVTSEEGKK